MIPLPESFGTGDTKHWFHIECWCNALHRMAAKTQRPLSIYDYIVCVDINICTSLYIEFDIVTVYIMIDSVCYGRVMIHWMQQVQQHCRNQLIYIKNI